MKKINLNLLLWALLLLVFTQQTNGQGWRQTYNGGAYNYAFTLMNTADGGFLMDGDRQLKADGDGNLQWGASYPNVFTGNRRAVMLNDGSYVVIYGTNEETELKKFDSFGNEIWAQQYSLSTGNETFTTSVDQTPDGGFIFLVNYYENTCSCWRYYVLRTDASGNLLWQADSGTNLAYQALSVKALSDGGYAISGWHGADNTTADLYVEKRDASGNQLWEKEWPAPNFQQFNSIIETSDGNIVAAGHGGQWWLPPGDEALYLVKLDQTGNETWFSNWVPSSFTAVWDLKETAAGTYVFVGDMAVGVNGHSGFIFNADANAMKSGRRHLPTIASVKYSIRCSLAPTEGWPFLAPTAQIRPMPYSSKPMPSEMYIPTTSLEMCSSMWPKTAHLTAVKQASPIGW